jgi:hypothetical protein
MHLKRSREDLLISLGFPCAKTTTLPKPETRIPGSSLCPTVQSNKEIQCTNANIMRVTEMTSQLTTRSAQSENALNLMHKFRKCDNVNILEHKGEVQQESSLPRLLLDIAGSSSAISDKSSHQPTTSLPSTNEPADNDIGVYSMINENNKDSYGTEKPLETVPWQAASQIVLEKIQSIEQADRDDGVSYVDYPEIPQRCLLVKLVYAIDKHGCLVSR